MYILGSRCAYGHSPRYQKSCWATPALGALVVIRHSKQTGDRLGSSLYILGRCRIREPLSWSTISFEPDFEFRAAPQYPRAKEMSGRGGWWRRCPMKDTGYRPLASVVSLCGRREKSEGGKNRWKRVRFHRMLAGSSMNRWRRRIARVPIGWWDRRSYSTRVHR